MEPKTNYRLTDIIPGGTSLNPTGTALNITIAYTILVAIYIAVSGKIAAYLAPDKNALELIETFKGFAYVGLTGAALFFFTKRLLKKIALKDATILAQARSIAATEGEVMAGIFASSAYHDVNNFLTVIDGNASLVNSASTLHDSTKNAIENILYASSQIGQTFKRIAELGQTHIPGTKITVDLRPWLEETISITKIYRPVKTCSFTTACPGNPTALMNKNLMTRALINLILNAAEATNGQGTIDIRIIQENESLVFEVHDDGPGLPDSTRSLVKQPFFTTKDHGSGLGLLSFQTAAQQHDGQAEIDSSPLGGACFRLRLPHSTLLTPIQLTPQE